MTIPFTVPFGRRRFVMSFDLLPAIPAPPARARRSPNMPAAIEATDAELAHINARSVAAKERARWETQAVLIGLRGR